MTRQPHVHRPDDLGALPRLTAADVRAGLWLVAFALLFVAICTVEPGVVR